MSRSGALRDRERVPLALGDRRHAHEDVIARIEVEAGRLLELDARDPRAQRLRREDRRRGRAAEETKRLLHRETHDRHAGPERERRRVRDGEREPRDVEEVGEIEELEAPAAPNERERERPHHREDGEEREPRRAARVLEDSRGRRRVPARVREDVRRSVRDRDAEERVPDEAVEIDRLVERDQLAEERRAKPREQAPHHRDEDERAVQVGAAAEGSTDLRGGVRRGGGVREHRVDEDGAVREHPEHDEERRQPAVLRSERGPRSTGARVEPREKVLVRRDPHRLAARHLRQQERALAHDRLELLERDDAVAVRVGRPEERTRQRLGRLRRPHDLGLA